MRGGILDVWSPGQAQPVRIEFFGDEVDSIRAFDPETQLSTNQLKSIEIVPMREAGRAAVTILATGPMPLASAGATDVTRERCAIDRVCRRRRRLCRLGMVDADRSRTKRNRF